MDLSRAKKRRGAARASITHLRDSVDKLEAKLELSRTDHLMVSRLVKKLEDWTLNSGSARGHSGPY